MKHVFCLIATLLLLAGPAAAYIDAPPTLGRLIQYDATSIVVVRVQEVSKEKGAILYSKVAVLKGKYPGDEVKQAVSRRIADAPGPEDNPRPRGAHPIMDWAKPGAEAVLFLDDNRKVVAMCVGGAWYFGWEGKEGWWHVNEFEERGLSWAYVGTVEKLREHIGAILAGKEVVVTAARYDDAGGGTREVWSNQTAYRNLANDPKVRLWRIRASTRITSYTDAMADRSKFVVGLGSGDRGAVPALLERLKDREAAARRAAAEGLAAVGPEAKSAAPALLAALKDPDRRVRIEAAEALGEVGAKADAVAPVLAEALGDREVGVRRAAVRALWRLGPQAAPAASALATALTDGDRDVRRDAVETLWRVGPPAKSTLRALVGALEDGDEIVRRGAAGTLGTFDAATKEVEAALARALKDKNPDVRYLAARALVRRGGPTAKEGAVGVLREALRDNRDSRVRAEAVVFLWKAGPQPESTFPTLASGDAGAVMAATQLLSKADEATRKNAVPTLLAAFRGTRDSNHRAALAHALGQIGPDARSAVPALETALSAKDEAVRNAAKEALTKIRRN